MEVIRTVNLKLNLTPDQEKEALATMKLGRDVWNECAAYCFQHKIKSYLTLNKALYHELTKSGLPSAIVQNIERNVTGNAKTTKLSKMVKRKLTLPLGQRSLTVRGDQITFSTIGKRIKTISVIPAWFKKRYTNFSPTYGTLQYKNGTFTLSLICKVVLPATPTSRKVLGIDRGIYSVVATSDGHVEPSQRLRARNRKTLFTTRKLQQKGTKSANRNLKNIFAKQKRFMLDVNHCISKKLVSSVGTLVLENLEGIKKSSKGKKLNRWLSNWTFYALQTLIEYKAEAQNKTVVYINPAHTSQRCSSCGKISKSNRTKNRYSCSCGYKGHSDINAAINIRNKFLSGLCNQSRATSTVQMSSPSTGQSYALVA